MFLPPPLAVGSLQYSAGFRKNAWAAKAVAVLHFMGAAVALFALVTNVGEHLFEGGSWSLDLCMAVAVVFVLVLYLSFCGWMNLRLAKYLRAEASQVEQAVGNQNGPFAVHATRIIGRRSCCGHHSVNGRLNYSQRRKAV